MGEKGRLFLASLLLSSFLMIAYTFISMVVVLVFKPREDHLPFIFILPLAQPFIMIGGWYISGRIKHNIAKPFAYLSGILMGVLFYSVLACFAMAFLLIVFEIIGIRDIPQVARSLEVLFPGMVFIPIAFGLVASRRIRTTGYRVPFFIDGETSKKIAVVTDIHMGPTNGRGRLRSIIEKTRQNDPDLMMLVGDIFDTYPGNIPDLVDQLGTLTRDVKTYFVSGNHEFFNDPEECFDSLERIGVRVLRNELITDEKTGIVIAGVDDPMSIGSRKVQERRLEEVLSSVKDTQSGPILLLSHQPIGFENAANKGVKLMVCGHTHSGQLWPLGYLTRVLYKDGDRGLIRKYGSYMFVSRGVGTWGPPLRVLSPPEITIIELV